MKDVYMPEDWDKLEKKIEEIGLKEQGITSNDVLYYCGLALLGKEKGKNPVDYYETEVVKSSMHTAKNIFAGRIQILGKDAEKIKRHISTFSPKEHSLMISKLKKIQETTALIDYLKKEEFFGVSD